jgi:RNase adaptor protein for sRNA GlmZ degradation
MSLKIKIFSFSYLYTGIPEDDSEHGGGFVFDCRFIDNPGRIPDFFSLTGKDKPVKDYLDSNKEMQQFLKDVYSIIDAAIDNYIERDFTGIMVSFGCTGGQHRSVYSAERLNEHINNKYANVTVELKHKNLN